MTGSRFKFLPLVAVLVVVIVFGLILVSGHQERPETALNGPVPVTAVPVPDNPSAESVRPDLPSVDLLGNRLEPSGGDPAGVPLPQDGTQRRADAGQTAGLDGHFTEPPAGLIWRKGWRSAALGFSRGDGPVRVRDGVASGFARSPQGAALAAYDAIGRAAAAPDGVWQRVLAERYHGGGAALLERFGRARGNHPDAARYVVVPDGFRVLAGYRPDFAVVEIAVRAARGWSSSTWPMVWVDGDWRVRVPDDVADLWAKRPLDSLVGFGVWK